MSPRTSITVVLFLSVVSMKSLAVDNENDYLRTACNVTEYPDLCFTTLSPWPSAVKRSPSELARAAISVTVTETKNVTRYILGLRHLRLGVRASMALTDCIECFGDALDNLHRSLFEIRLLESGTFKLQVSNMQTWLSAALTNEDTCLDGFNGCNSTALVQGLNSNIEYLAQITSNALALINRLASTGW